jgi:TonB family protein
MAKSVKYLLALCIFSMTASVANAQAVAYTNPDRTEKLPVDEMAKPEYDWNEYLRSTLKYPQEAFEKNLQGRVVVEMKVDVDGTLSDIKVVRGEHAPLTKEAMRVVKSAPKWKPAMKDDKAVASYIVLPIVFRL